MHSLVRHYFFPHHTNNFKARLLHIEIFAILIVSLLSISVVARGISEAHPAVLGFATDINIEALIAQTNQKRAEAGTGNLRLSSTLSQAAAAKAAHMFQNNYWAHNAPDGTTPWTFIQHAGYTYQVAGENLAKNFSNSSGVVEAWMNSPTHRENLLRGQYEEVGFAILNGTLQGEETTLVVQMFGKPLAPTEVKEIAAPAPLVAAAQAVEEAQPSPLPVAASPLAVPDTTPAVPAVATNAKPIFDIRSLSKQSLLIMSFIIMATLVADGLYIWKQRIVRVSSRNSAHLLFLAMITGVIWAVSFGSVL